MLEDITSVFKRTEKEKGLSKRNWVFNAFLGLSIALPSLSILLVLLLRHNGIIRPAFLLFVAAFTAAFTMLALRSIAKLDLSIVNPNDKQANKDVSLGPVEKVINVITFGLYEKLKMQIQHNAGSYMKDKGFNLVTTRDKEEKVSKVARACIFFAIIILAVLLVLSPASFITALLFIPILSLGVALAVYPYVRPLLLKNEAEVQPKNLQANPEEVVGISNENTKDKQSNKVEPGADQVNNLDESSKRSRQGSVDSGISNDENNSSRKSSSSDEQSHEIESEVVQSGDSNNNSRRLSNADSVLGGRENSSRRSSSLSSSSSSVGTDDHNDLDQDLDDVFVLQKEEVHPPSSAMSKVTNEMASESNGKGMSK